MSQQKLFGTLRNWSASEHGGWGHVIVADGRKFFLHRIHIVSGSPTPGASVIFVPKPPATDRPYPRATEAILNSRTPDAQATRFVPRDLAPAATERACALLAGGK